MIKVFYLILTVGFLLFDYNIVNAGPGNNVWGWAWSENIGWISFNNISVPGYDPDNPANVNYGVNVDINTEVMSGAAWSENIGWISFDGAIMDIGTNEISGWARACSVFSSGCSGALAPDNIRGGWDGFIKLRGTIQTGGTYGLWADNSYNPMQIKNWAWSDNVIGWISFNCANTPGACSNSDYKVFLSLNSPPSVEVDAPYVSQPNPEMTDCPIRVLFKWQYNDSDGDPQSEYIIEVDNNAGFPSPDYTFSAGQEVPAGSITNPPYIPITSIIPVPEGDLPQNTHFWWRIKVKDSEGNWSSPWKEGPEFDTPIHQDPKVIFNWSPPGVPQIGEEISFFSETLFYDAVCSSDPDDSQCAYLWSFPADATDPDGNPIDVSMRNPYVVFSESGTKTVTLTVTDSDGLTCSQTKTLRINIPPKWWEVIPF